MAIERLWDAIAVLRSGSRALKSENAELRREVVRMRGERGASLGVDDPAGRGRGAELRLPVDVSASAAARELVAACLAARVAASVVASAQLLISELVGNSVRHGAGPPGQVLIVRVALEHAVCRLEVEDGGSAGEVVRRAPDVRNGGGLGLNIVQALSERWGVERAAKGGTRVWAYLPRAPLTAPDHGPRAVEVARVAAQV